MTPMQRLITFGTGAVVPRWLRFAVIAIFGLSSCWFFWRFYRTLGGGQPTDWVAFVIALTDALLFCVHSIAFRREYARGASTSPN